MKNVKLIFLVLISFLFVLTGCVIVDSDIDDDDNDNYENRIYGSGRLITLTKDYRDFNRIELQSGFSVKVVKSENYSVSIEVDDNVAGYVNTYQSGSKIYLGLSSGYSYKNVTLKAVIETPDVESIKANGGVVIEFLGNELYNKLSMELNGGSTVKGLLNIENLNLKLNGGSIVDLSGTAKNLDIIGSGGAILRLYGFPVEYCNLNFNGGCIAYLNVTNLLNVTLSGGSIVKYKGDPTIGSISISGGSIIQRDN